MMPGKSLMRRLAAVNSTASGSPVRSETPSRFRRADHVACDHQLLDLTSAFVDPEQSHVAIEALDGIVADVAGATMDLHRTIGDPAAHFRREELGACCLGRHVAPFVAAPRRVQYHRAGGVDLGLAV